MVNSTDQDHPYVAAAARLAASDKDGAIRILQSARLRALADGANDESASIGLYLASILGAMRRFDEAEALFREIEAQDPENPLIGLRFAALLTHSLARPQDALPRLTKALPGLSDLSSTIHEGHAVLGATLLALGRAAEAAEAFRNMTAPEVLASLPAASCDLWLVSLLVEARLSAADSAAYLQVVIQKASREGEPMTLEKAEQLLVRCSNTTLDRESHDG